ncbi:Protein of unknown function [Cohaesibacter sp. ES.047]|uniref:DUF2834 domain-containing protein n=1 Tax=Cohaesibacter sp. ES.047 TaxID=1798205 RepID=UPI000BB6839E|nr:DUF2834 domain-containing protein [Cohaesibacter sp. ES.047]SNY93868.1 Protein of unknown function [Cohaesibacter sp. ES.047]
MARKQDRISPPNRLLIIFYLFMCVVGTIVPWLGFVAFLFEEGVDLPLFVTSTIANPVAAGFTADLLISILVFWVWAVVDARREDVRNWWLIIPSTFCVGLSLALPLYLFLRERVRMAP